MRRGEPAGHLGGLRVQWPRAEEPRLTEEAACPAHQVDGRKTPFIKHLRGTILLPGLSLLVQLPECSQEFLGPGKTRFSATAVVNRASVLGLMGRGTVRSRMLS